MNEWPLPSLQTLNERKKLPAYAFIDEILDSITNHTVTLIRGETGSGKTTQVSVTCAMYIGCHMSYILGVTCHIY